MAIIKMLVAKEGGHLYGLFVGSMSGFVTLPKDRDLISAFLLVWNSEVKCGVCNHVLKDWNHW